MPSLRLKTAPAAGPETSSAYGAFVQVEDEYWRSFGPEFYRLVLPLLDGLLKQFHLKPNRLLDLGCGTGGLAIEWASRGLSVTGVDASPMAIQAALAKGRATSSRGRLRFVCADMRSFRDGRRYDWVTCIFNTVNHLADTRGLFETFQTAAEALTRGGFFFFDLNDRRCFETIWKGRSEVRRKNFIVLRQDHFDRKTRQAIADLSIGVKNGKGYRYSRDTIRERWFTRSEIRRALRQAGFRIRLVVPFNPFDPNGDRRIKSFWVCQKRGSSTERSDG